MKRLQCTFEFSNFFFMNKDFFLRIEKSCGCWDTLYKYGSSSVNQAFLQLQIIAF